MELKIVITLKETFKIFRLIICVGTYEIGILFVLNSNNFIVVIIIILSKKVPVIV